MIEPHWYALYVRSRSEKRVGQRLSERGIATFLPLVEEVHTWSDRRRRVLEPLFRGYIFVRSDLKEREQILSTDGVVYMVGNRHAPSPIPDAQILSLQVITRNPGIIVREPEAGRGQHVRVVAGPCAGIEGIVKDIRGKTHVVVIVEVIAQGVSVAVPFQCLEPIGSLASCSAA